ncbi:MAG: hypothetical protein QNK19_07365 [Xanthomonadales bacterium]|nr:hypothetical protein [Xanthomonadales bacterium]
MKFITDEDLTLLFYGEHEDPALAVTVAQSEELSARYDALCAELKLADAYQPPQRGDDYGAEVWQRISSQLGEEDTKSTGRLGKWFASLLQPRFSLAGALSIALVAALAFTLGRNGGQEIVNDPTAPTGVIPMAMADIDASRLLTHSVSTHLEQVNLVLTQFVNTAETSANETEYATDMLVANRLYRQAAVSRGNHKLAAFLADLEPLLIELAYQAQSGSTATRERMQQEVKDGLLFRVRVMNKQLNKPEVSV